MREYVLPSFLIEVEATSFVLPSTKKIEGRCRAAYVFGRQVNGTVSFKFGFRQEQVEKVTFIGRTNYKNLVEGRAQFAFNARDFHSYAGKDLFRDSYRFVVEAEVRRSNHW